jgi:hypothetical protein
MVTVRTESGMTMETLSSTYPFNTYDLCCEGNRIRIQCMDVGMSIKHHHHTKLVELDGDTEMG